MKIGSYQFRKPERGPTIAMLLVTAFLFKLGFWQLDRLQWKTNLMAAIEQAQSQPPHDLLSYPPSALPGAEWHNVIVKGTLLNGKELYATPRYLKEKMGYAIVTPLAMQTPSGVKYVLINRGWVAGDRKDPATRAAGNPATPVTVEGVIRTQVERGWLWRKFFANSPQKNLWLWYDLPAMAQHAGVPVLPVLIDATRVTLADGKTLKNAPEPFPLEINIRNDHLGYAITWFLIGISCVVIYGAYYTERNK